MVVYKYLSPELIFNVNAGATKREEGAFSQSLRGGGAQPRQYMADGKVAESREKERFEVCPAPLACAPRHSC